MNKGIQKIFSQVPETYELINHILTGYFDVIMRKKTAKLVAGLGGEKWLDVCSGTGELVNYLGSVADKNTQIFAADFSLPMLSESISKPGNKKVKYILSDIQKLPFNNNTFDVITISFATRNINLNRKVLIHNFCEFYRILKPGGYFINLETSQPGSKILKKLFHLYIKLLVKPIGTFISGSDAGYHYLSHTIPKFYSAGELAKLIKLAGFNKIQYHKLFFGIAAIHQGMKI